MKIKGTGIIRLIFMLAMLAASALPVNASTTLLPNAKQCFSSASGPIAGGSIYMYYPATTTYKMTWVDSAQSAANPQPIPLDSNGCALIYGVGAYRQVVYEGPDSSSTLLWDQVTVDTSAYNAVFWAALAAGTPNVITVVDTGFNATDGTVINFTALGTNTSTVTINPSGYGAIPLLKDTTAGPVSLTGGEIIQNNVISVVYRSSDNAFHLLNPPIQSVSGSSSPRCGITNLKIVNDAVTPNSIVDITASVAVLTSASGISLNRSNISTTVNLSLGTVTSTAGGMDGEAIGTNNFLYLFLVDNGSGSSAVGSLASGNGLVPALPSGYIYSCYAGSVKVDGSSNLYRTQQQGTRVQFVVTPATNTAAYPTIQNATATGMVTVRGNTGSTVWFPPTATAVNVLLYHSGISTSVVGANSATTGGLGLASVSWSTTTGSQVITMNIPILLESNQIYISTDGGTNSGVTAYEWTDGQANAN